MHQRFFLKSDKSREEKIRQNQRGWFPSLYRVGKEEAGAGMAPVSQGPTQNGNQLISISQDLVETHLKTFCNCKDKLPFCNDNS